MPAQGIDHLCPLPDQQIPLPEDHAEHLLFRRLHLDETHGRPTARLRDRLGIRHVVLLGLHIRLHELRGQSGAPHARWPPASAPVMSGRASFHRNDARRVRLHEHEELLARQLLAKHDLAARCGPVQLKGLLRQVHTNNRDFLHGISS